KAGRNIGDSSGDVALSLIKGSWNLYAGWDPIAQKVQDGVGIISLQEVRNPNGVFNSVSGGSNAGRHLFDYDPLSSIGLYAGLGVYLTGLNIPRPAGSIGVPIIFPPSLDIAAGAEGVVLEKTVILFPSTHQDLNIKTTSGGSLVSQ